MSACGKYVLILLLGILMLSAAALGCRNTPALKVAVNLGLVNGGSLGILADHDKDYRRLSYVNFNYMYSDLVDYAGLSYVEQRPWNDRFYYMWAGGFDYGKAKPIMGNPGGPDGDEAEYNYFLIPHITFGLGYDFARWKRGAAFIEWDIGIKASVTNINVGVTF
jgi:hypothetical protein